MTNKASRGRGWHGAPAEHARVGRLGGKASGRKRSQNRRDNASVSKSNSNDSVMDRVDE